MDRTRRLGGTAVRLLFIACVPLLIISASIAWVVNSLWIYERGLAKYDISRVTGISQAELNKAAAGLISYFNSAERDINVAVIKDGKPFTLFNQREVDHLRDVKALFWLDYRMLMATLAYCLGFAAVSLWRRRGRQLARAGLVGGIFSLGLMGVLGVAMLFDFSGLFLQFHVLSFSNDLWQLDPARDYLVMMFPEGFWFDAAKYIAMAAVILAVAVTVGSGLYLKMRRPGG